VALVHVREALVEREVLGAVALHVEDLVVENGVVAVEDDAQHEVPVVEMVEHVGGIDDAEEWRHFVDGMRRRVAARDGGRGLELHFDALHERLALRRLADRQQRAFDVDVEDEVAPEVADAEQQRRHAVARHQRDARREHDVRGGVLKLRHEDREEEAVAKHAHEVLHGRDQVRAFRVRLELAPAHG